MTKNKKLIFMSVIGIILCFCILFVPSLATNEYLTEENSENINITINGTGKINVLNENKEFNKTFEINQSSTIQVPKNEKLQIEIIGDKIYSLENILITDTDKNNILTPEIKENIRNCYFDMTVDKELNIDIQMKENDSEVAMFDKESGEIYWEGLLYGDDCLEKYVRNHEQVILPTIEAKGNSIIRESLKETLTTSKRKSRSAISTASLNYVPTKGDVITGSAKITFLGSDIYKPGKFKVELTSGDLQGESGIYFECMDPGKANPGYAEWNSYGSYTAICDYVGSGYATYIVEAAPTDYKINNFQRVGAKLTITYVEPNGGLGLIKQSADTNKTSGNANYSIQGAVYGVYRDYACTDHVIDITTDIYGYAATSNTALKAGTYYVKEKTASTGYLLDTTIYTYTVIAGQTAWDNQKTVYETPKTTTISLTKKSGNETITKDNSNYTLKGAVYTVYTDASCTTAYTTMTTDENGKASISLPLNKYWIKETSAPKGYLLDEKVYALDLTTSTSGSVNSTDKPKTTTILLTKKSGNETITKDNSNYTLKGAVYTVYTDASCTTAYTTMTTDENGKASVSLPLNKYWVKETSAPTGYLLDEKVYELDLRSATSGSVDSSDMPKTAGINLVKISGDTSITNNNDAYTLKNAVYTIYDDADCKNKINTMITDINGKASINNLPLNKYWIKETSASKGYKLDETVYELDLTISENATVSKDITSTEVPFTYHNVLSMLLGKIDKETNNNKPQGSATLENAEYAIKFYPGIHKTNPAEVVLPLKSWVFKTDKDGEIKFTQDYLVSGSEFFEDNNWPLGTITIQEIKAPKGYLLNNEIKVINLNTTKDNTKIETYNIPISKEEVVKGNFLFVKYGYNEDKKDETLKPLQGAEFTVTSKTTGKIVMNLISDKNGTVTSKTNKNEDIGSLPYDTYIITEIKSPEGYQKVDPFEITIDKDGMTKTGYIIEDKLIVSALTVLKVDKTTGRSIKIANAEFKLLDKDLNPISMKESLDSKKTIDIFKTNENGQISFTERLPFGTYYLQEIKAPNGYLKGGLLKFNVTEYSTADNPLVVEYEDSNAMGQIIINKTDEETKEVLTDATYTITAAENIVTNDGTIRASKGEVVDVITTDKDGVAKSKELYLGKYQVQETQQPNGYVRDKKVYDVSLEYKDQNTALVSKTLELTNKPSIIGIEKYDQVSTNPMFGVQFKIWNKKDDENTGKIYTTDKNGKIELKYIKIGTYNMREIKSLPGYAVKDTIYEFTVDDDGRINGKDKDSVYVGNLHIKMIGTTAINQDSNNHFALGVNSTFIDTVNMSGLQVGKEYVLKATVMDILTKKPIEINNETIQISKTFIATSSDQNVAVEIPIAAKELIGKTVNIFEELYDEGILIAEHKDLKDEDQNITIKTVNIATSAIATDTNSRLSLFGKNSTIIDTVSYKGLIPNLEYKMQGILIDKETGNALEVDGKQVIAKTIFTPKGENGTVDVTFNFDSSLIKGKDVVVYETLYRLNKEVSSHKDITDKNQTIQYPDIEIKTKAINKDTNTQFAQVDNKLTFVDTVSYSGLVPNYKYKMSGVLMDKETGKAIEIDGKQVTATTTFTPKESNGTVDVVFTVDTTKLEGKDIVVFEKLYYVNVEFANHEDITDKNQTITVPKIEIKTKAINKDTNTQFAQVGNKLTFVDTVSYSGLVPNYEYKMSGVLMDKETGKEIEIDGKQVTATTTFTPKEANGTVDVVFTVDTTKLEGKEIVVFEKLYYSNVEMSKHEDIKDNDQTITVPKIEIKTKAINKDTNTQFAQVGNKLTFVDTVSYIGLVPNYKYKMSGVLMDKETGKAIEVDGKQVTAETTFTPKESNGTVDVVFTVDTTKLEGKEIVVFEKLYYSNVEMSKHEDIKDKNQTITVPKIEIKTKAINKDTNTQFAQVGDKLTFVDTVSYSGLVPGYEYKMSGILMDKETGEAITINVKNTEENKEDGEETLETEENKCAITAETTFTPKKENGTVDVVFTVDTTKLEGKDIVVFEKLYYGNVEMSKHEDIEDKDQTITVSKIEIKTKAINKDTNTQFAQVGDKLTFVDTVSYSGLVPDYEYKMSGILMDKETGKAIEVNGKQVTAETTFTPKESDGTIDVTFTVDTTKLEGKNIVVFEKLYYSNVEMSKHEDINDKDQTITVPKIEIKTKVSEKTVDPKSNFTFKDTVSYSGLVPNYEYKMSGVLMDKETGKVIKVNGKQVTAETTFTPKEASGTIDVTFTVDTTSLAGKSIVVFEKLYYGSVEMSKHEDINDEAQTFSVNVPKIQTKTGDNHLKVIIPLGIIMTFGLVYIGFYIKRKKY